MRLLTAFEVTRGGDLEVMRGGVLEVTRAGGGR